MSTEEKRLYEAFTKDAEIPLAVQSRLRRTYEQVRQLDRAERNTMSHKKTTKFIKTLLIAAVLVLAFIVYMLFFKKYTEATRLSDKAVK